MNPAVFKVLEVNPQSKECTAEGIEALSVEHGIFVLVVRVDYDHPLTKAQYKRLFVFPELSYLFTLGHAETGALVTAHLIEQIGKAMVREMNYDHDTVAKWILTQPLTEIRGSGYDLEDVVNHEAPLEFLN